MSSGHPGEFNMATQASIPTRLRVWLTSIPAITRTILLFCTMLFVMSSLAPNTILGHVCVSASGVAWRAQLWRLVTSIFFHGSLVHLLFNMMAFASIGPLLERNLGSLQFLWLIGVLGLLGNGLFIGVGTLTALPPLRWTGIVTECVIGFSGVLFGLIPVETVVQGVRSYNVMGVVSIPAPLYPWALIVVCQLLVRHVSFLGHLCGLLVGLLVAHGYAPLLFPDATTIMTKLDPALSSGLLPGYVSFMADLSSSQQLLRSLARHRPQYQELPSFLPRIPPEGSRLAEFWQGLWQAYPPGLTPGTPPAPPPVLEQEQAGRMAEQHADLPPPGVAAGAAAHARASAAVKRADSRS